MVFAFMKLRINNIFHHIALEKMIRKSTTVSISTRTKSTDSGFRTTRSNDNDCIVKNTAVLLTNEVKGLGPKTLKPK